MIPLIILAVAALLTSILSGIIGMGGGILMLAAMLSFLSHGETIPVHGAVQLASNGTRLLAFLNHVNWRVVGKFALGAVPGTLIGGAILWWWRKDNIEPTEPYIKILIGLYVLVMGFARSNNNAADDQPPQKPTEKGFFLFGCLAGTLGLTVGAIGPLIAPLFIRNRFAKQEVVATKSVCQAIIHALKIPVFLAGGLVDYGKFGVLLVILCLMAIPGTLIGRRIHDRVDEAMFLKLYKLAMLLAGSKVLLYDGIYKLLTISS